MPSALVALAPGFEEVEGVAPIDVLRRGGVEVVVAGLGDRRVTSARGLVLEAETTVEAVAALEPARPWDALVLPGGMGGAERLAASPAIRALVARQLDAGRLVAAICAAPAVVLAPAGFLAGRRATCYPGLERRFGPDVTHVPERVVEDGPVLTSQGPGTALDFSLAVLARLTSRAAVEKLRAALLASA